MDQPRFQANERLDLQDLVYAVDTNVANAQRQPIHQFMAKATGKWIIDGFAISNPSGKQLQVTRGVAILAERQGAQTAYGVITSEGDATKTVDMTSYASATYGVYIRFEYVDGDSASRIFWNPSGAGSEYASTIPTRRKANWSLRVELANPGTEWLKIGEVVQSSMAITDQRPFYFEGTVNGTYPNTWGTGNDRNADRKTHGVKDFQTFVAAMRQCLEDIKGVGLRRWWDDSIGGMNVGFSASPVEDRVAVGDATFYLDRTSSTAPILVWDTNDSLGYNRSTNTLTGTIGSTARATLNATGLGLSVTPVNRLDVSGGVVIGSGVAYAGVASAPSNGMLVEGSVGIGTTGLGGEKFVVFGAGANGGGGVFQSSDNANRIQVRGVDGASINDVAFYQLHDGTHFGYFGMVGTGAAGTGNVGDVRIVCSAVQAIRVNRLNRNVMIGSAANPQSRLDVQGGLTVGGTYAGSQAAPADGVLIQGNVGIGTGTAANTQAKLHVLSNAAALVLEGTTHTFMAFYPDGFAAGRKGYLGFPGASNDSIELNNEMSSNGNILVTCLSGHVLLTPATAKGVGIGVTPMAKLDVDGGAIIGSGASYAGVATPIADGLIVQGNVSIGKTANTAPLDVVGNIVSSATMTAAAHASTAGPTSYTWASTSVAYSISALSAITGNSNAGPVMANETDGSISAFSGASIAKVLIPLRTPLTGTLTQVIVPVSVTFSTNGTVEVSLWSSNAGQIGATQSVTSASYTNVTFNVSHALSAGAHYWVLVEELPVGDTSAINVKALSVAVSMTQLSAFGNV